MTTMGPCWNPAAAGKIWATKIASKGLLSPIPDAVVIRAMDGVVLGVQLAQQPLLLAKLLQGYYRTSLEMGRPLQQLQHGDFGVLVQPGWLEKEETKRGFGDVVTHLAAPEGCEDTAGGGLGLSVSQELNDCYVGMGRGCHPLNRFVTTQMGVVTPKRGLSPPKQELLPHKGGLSPHKWGLSLHKWGGKGGDGTPGEWGGVTLVGGH